MYATLEGKGKAATTAELSVGCPEQQQQQQQQQWQQRTLFMAGSIVKALTICQILAAACKSRTGMLHSEGSSRDEKKSFVKTVTRVPSVVILIIIIIIIIRSHFGSSRRGRPGGQCSFLCIFDLGRGRTVAVIHGCGDNAVGRPYCLGDRRARCKGR